MSPEGSWSLIESALVGSGVTDGVPCTFVEALMPGLVAEHPLIMGEQFRRAVDRRALEPLRRFHTRNFAGALAILRGRQVGTLGSIVPTGRAFATLAHVMMSFEGGRVRGITVESALVSELTGCAIRVRGDREPRVRELVVPAAAERSDLLAGDVEATYWARAWRLPPRLARLAVLLMAGLSSSVISRRAGLSIRSVRTYTEDLLARAGLHSRNELALAALRDGSVPFDAR